MGRETVDGREAFLLRADAVKDISFPTWAEICDKVNPGCSASWKEKVGPQVGFGSVPSLYRYY